MLLQNLSIVDIRSRLSEIKFDIVSEHLEDDPDEFAGTVPKGIVMSPAFRHLGIIVSQQWKDDYAMDEAGAFPEKLRRGVLSQDGIWNMLERNRELTQRLGIGDEEP